jgi:putative ABC transport system substrate-binding protein
LAITIVIDVGDPVGSGFAASLARPGGNVTGLSLMRPDMAAKQLQLFHEVVPTDAIRISRLAPIY